MAMHADFSSDLYHNKKEEKKGCICYAHVIMAILNHYAKLSGIGFWL